ncbi:MAG TPA: serine/threonine-protein kinase [Nocardioides sp.]|nr:serine/threonine-protein kinase [Nocardioides sp.]
MPPPLGPGDRLGPYRVVRRLGAGGMGTVHEAVEEVLGRSVAVKVIAPGLAGDPAFRARFTAEARAMAALDSPHVVQVHAYGEIDGVLYLATQLVPDGDLARLVRDHGPLPRRAALDVVAQVAEGLAEAHRVGLLHRDIKAANVLLRDRGEGWTAYLADFGLARPAGGTGDGAGTPAYLAPEVAAGGASSVAADVYAMGCLLRLALTGRPGGRPRAGRDVARILERALADDPAERYADVLALRDDLLAAAARRRTARRPVLVGVAAVVLTGGAWFGVDRDRRPPAAPAPPSAYLVGELRRAHLGPAHVRCVVDRLRAENGDPGSTADVFDATAACLWPAAEQVTDR